MSLLRTSLRDSCGRAPMHISYSRMLHVKSYSTASTKSWKPATTNVGTPQITEEMSRALDVGNILQAAATPEVLSPIIRISNVRPCDEHLEMEVEGIFSPIPRKTDLRTCGQQLEKEFGGLASSATRRTYLRPSDHQFSRDFEGGLPRIIRWTNSTRRKEPEPKNKVRKPEPGFIEEIPLPPDAGPGAVKIRKIKTPLSAEAYDIFTTFDYRTRERFGITASPALMHKKRARWLSTVAFPQNQDQPSAVPAPPNSGFANRRYNSTASPLRNPKTARVEVKTDQAMFLNSLSESEILAYCKQLVAAEVSAASQRTLPANEDSVDRSAHLAPVPPVIRRTSRRERPYASQEANATKTFPDLASIISASQVLEKTPPMNGKRRGTSLDPESSPALIRRHSTNPRSYVYQEAETVIGQVKRNLCLGIDPLLLRDSCQCHLCVDPSSKQKNFQTTDLNLEDVENFKTKDLEDGKFEVTWGNGPDPHVSVFHEGLLKLFKDREARQEHYGHSIPCEPWNAKGVLKCRLFMSYAEYMGSDESLFEAVTCLYKDGILILKGAPTSEKTIEDIGGRIGVLRDTFYGRTWDVKSIPKAKNVAYTQQYLGLHQDLLYVTNTPGFQLLHCLKNTCTGGTSLFSDSFQAAASLSTSDFNSLCDAVLPYHYDNDGQSYYQNRRVIELLPSERQMKHRRHPAGIGAINYSPPFQAPIHRENRSAASRQNFGALQSFAKLVESRENLFEYRLQEGDCVIFNNRRILHGRTEFDAAGGERWLKGTYVDTDVFMSRLKVMHDSRQREMKEITVEDRLREFEKGRGKEV